MTKLIALSYVYKDIDFTLLNTTKNQESYLQVTCFSSFQS